MISDERPNTGSAESTGVHVDKLGDAVVLARALREVRRLLSTHGRGDYVIIRQTRPGTLGDDDLWAVISTASALRILREEEEHIIGKLVALGVRVSP